MPITSFVQLEESGTTQILRSRPVLADRFEMVSVLGEGAAGAVYLVRDKKHDDKEVALKILMNNSAFDENTLERFLGELKVCQTIHHKNIVEAYDLIHLGDSIAFTMEYVPGADLGKLFRSKRFKYAEIDSIFTQVLEGLSALHAQDVVHRDMKLENILIGEDGSVKISDLGLMKWGSFESLTRTGILLGTAQYMPPEYVRDSTFDHRGDLYAVGLMLFEVLTGKRRLSDKTGNEALEYLIRTRFELPRISLTGLPRKYLALIDTATAPNPLDRYQSAEEMREVFQATPTPEEDGELERRREPQTQRFCEKSALSSALLEKNRRGSPFARWAMMGTLLALTLVGVVFGINKYSQVPLLLVGEYHGMLELYGGTSIQKPMRLTVKTSGIEFWSGLEHCRTGTVAKGGDIRCEREGMRLKIDDFDDRHITGSVVDLKQKEIHAFRVDRKSPA